MTPLSHAQVVPSLVRTALPYSLSATTLLAARIGLDLPEQMLTEPIMVALTFVIGTAYYALARLVERYLSPLWGALMLGSGRTPTYTPTHPTRAAGPAPEPLVAGTCATQGDCLDRDH